MDERDLAMAISTKIKVINDQTGVVVAGLLYGNLSEAEQIAFAYQLVDVAELLKLRATGDFQSLVVEGVVCDGRQ